MQKEAKWVSKFYFLEVGIQIGSFEGYLIFSVPYGFKAKRFDCVSGKYVFVDISDWLVLDFPTILCQRLNGGNPNRFRVISVSKVFLDPKNPVPVYQSSSNIDSWVSPFIDLFARTFINLSLYGK